MYITWTAVAGKYPDIAAKHQASGVDQYWIPAAESEVNAHLAARYTVPFSPCPEMVKDLVIDLIYYKMTYRGEDQEKLKKYIDERFEGLVNGTIILTDDAGVIETTGNSAWASNSYHSSFGPDSPEYWRVDRDWIDNAKDERDL